MLRYIKPVNKDWIDTLEMQKAGYYYYIIDDVVYYFTRESSIDIKVGRIEAQRDE